MSSLPNFIYGTAWKEAATSALTQKAVLAGFKAIDTANQKKHYREDYVGDALLELASKGIKRESLFLQTKFTYQRGQDHRLPYDPNDSFTKQVQASFASSLKNLHTDYIDSYLLHGPNSAVGIDNTDWEVWTAIEELHKSGQIKMIGVSNIGIQQLEELMQKSKIKPMIVQNRCYAERGWDISVREFCLSHGIIYQGFSLLTANSFLFSNRRLLEITKRHQVTSEQIVFRFARQIGILPLTGTSDEEHMKEDLKIFDFELSQGEIETIHMLSFDR
ncbi:MAG: aldo/keto reductase [Pseudomonadota bacterium]|nr:aldo/keto reductase [Pseudomonadota bacterium]